MMAERTAPDYVVVGHCALDRQPDGSFLPGGTVLYGALTAARLGMRAAILTAGDPAAITAALAPYRGVFAIHILPAAATTTFENIPTPTGRKQTLHAWAGPIPPDALPEAWRRPAVLHLAPIAAELPPDDWAEAIGAAWAGATPQGWLRRWESLPSAVRHETLTLPDRLLDRLRALVISSEERSVAEDALHRVAVRGLGALTEGADGVDIFAGADRTHVLAFPVTAVDETGAGDVFAAAWFIQMARGESPVAAARTACAAAAMSVTARGPNGIPTAAQVDALIAAYDAATAR